MDLQYMLYPILMNYASKINILELHWFYLVTLLIAVKIYNNRKISTVVFEKIEEFFNKSYHTIDFTSDTKEHSLKFKSLMYNLSSSNNPSITKIKELSKFYWNEDDERDEKNSFYQVDQTTSFNFTQDIFGKVIYRQEEDERNRDDRIRYKHLVTLRVYSQKKNLQELQDYISNQVDVYKNFLKSKSLSDQLLVTVDYNTSESNSRRRGEDEDNGNLKVSYSKWDSNITFENSWFNSKIKHLKTIKFFLENEEWYKKRGQPYNLGILLYGEPGGGKTRFIKQLMNFTKRHGIDVKLHNKFDFEQLRKIIQTEKIGSDLIIPQDKRIIIFEDIDAVGDIIKDRDIKTQELDDFIKENNTKESSTTKDMNNLVLKEKKQELNSNHLSNFLNILDGLHECSGRIIIMTTNKPEYLDRALIRPGRIDMKIEFKKCNTLDIYEMSKLYWEDEFVYELSDIKKDLDYKYTSAELINNFRSVNTFEEIKDLIIN